MKCPNCGNALDARAEKCPVCGQPFPHRPKQSVARSIISVLIWLACIAVLSLLLYKAYYWFAEYRLVRLYTRGAYTPTVSQIELSDGRVGHAVIYYGQDGDQIFLPELGYSTVIAGGTARFEFADSDWFEGMDTTQIEGAEIVFSPMRISQNGRQTKLPTLEIYISVPESPFVVFSPSEENPTVYTSAYSISGWVVPGSVVSINGEDITSYVDRAGNMALDVRVQPIGDNVYTFLVKTPNHRETRYDISIYRQTLPIDIELDDSVKMTASNATMTISGTTEPGATISVDTSHVEDSVFFNMETGEFSFIAQFETIGNNVVRFRASMDGREDAVISFGVYYVPSRAQYIDGAWKMDYAQLRLLFEQWHGRKFRCDGTIIDTLTQDGETYWVMDVGSNGEEQLILLTNDSTTTEVSIGRKYTAYADVAGRHMYKASYYPLLAVRYMDIYTES